VGDEPWIENITYFSQKEFKNDNGLCLSKDKMGRLFQRLKIELKKAYKKDCQVLNATQLAFAIYYSWEGVILFTRS